MDCTATAPTEQPDTTAADLVADMIRLATDMAPTRQRTTAFRSKNRKLATAATDILEAERPMTLRQLLYRLISAGELRNTRAEYSRLGSLMTRLREAGDIPRTWLVDHTRTTLKPSSWSGLADFSDSVRTCYRKDFWANMPDYVAIFVEKDAIAGTVQPVTEDNDVSLHVCRGYASISFAGEIADTWAEIEKPIFAYYLGDFDPSGFDLERDLREKLARYSGRYVVDHGDETESAETYNFVWQRLGVTEEDFQAHDLIRLPVKTADKRAAGFVRKYGTSCAEIDALPPSELRRRVSDAIDSHIDVKRWNRLLKVEQAERETLEQFVTSLRNPS